MSFTTRRFGWQLLLLATLLLRISCEPLPAEDAPRDDTAKYGRKLNDEERVAALEMLAKAMRENYEKIKTWKGEYHFIDGHRWPKDAPKTSDILYVPPGTSDQLNQGDIPTGKEAGGGHWQFERGNIRFSLDRTKNKYRAVYDAHEPIGYLDVESGSEGWSEKRGRKIIWLVTDGQSTAFDTENVEGELALRFPEPSLLPADWKSRVAYRNSTTFPGRLFQCVPIKEFFGSEVPGRFCELVASMLRGENGEELRKSIDKQISLYVNDESPPAYTMLRNHVKVGPPSIYVYDGKAGFNIIRQSYSSDTYRDEITVKYRRFTDVFFPENYRKRHDRLKDGRLQPSYYRGFDLVFMELNADIPESEFDPKQFGFRYGERMVDDRGRDSQKLYVYDDQLGFVPVAEFQFDPSRVPQEDK